MNCYNVNPKYEWIGYHLLVGATHEWIWLAYRLLRCNPVPREGIAVNEHQQPCKLYH